MAQPFIKLEHSHPTSHTPDVFNTAPSQTSDTPTMAASTPTPMGAFNMCDVPQQEQIDLLGRPVQKLVELIKELETLGVEAKNLPLPKIVVVGDQSAGKSSLIEGLSGIKVPRSDGSKFQNCCLMMAIKHVPSCLWRNMLTIMSF